MSSRSLAIMLIGSQRVTPKLLLMPIQVPSLSANGEVLPRLAQSNDCHRQGHHFIQEDSPEVIGRAIADWYRRNRRRYAPLWCPASTYDSSATSFSVLYRCRDRRMSLANGMLHLVGT